MNFTLGQKNEAKNFTLNFIMVQKFKGTFQQQLSQDSYTS